jgi:hypothetical protein
MTSHRQIVAALQVLRPGAEWSLSGDDYGAIVWRDQAQAQPGADEVAAAIAALPPAPLYVPTASLLSRLSAAEYTAIRQAAAAQLAAGDGGLERWLDMARTAIAGVDLNDPATVAAKAALVSGKLLAPARADAVFSA